MASRHAILLSLLVLLLFFSGCAKKLVPPAGGAFLSSRTFLGISVPQPKFNTEEYDYIEENAFREAASNPLSTFSIDVDTASYSNVRRFLNRNSLPPTDSVRIEELINYFGYDYQAPKDGSPLAVTVEMSACPWQKDHQLVHIGIKAKEIQADRIPPSNLVFLIDVSGSMESPNKLPLLRDAFGLLVKQLRAEDRVAMVVYAGAAGLVLPSTAGSEKETILKAIERLAAGGSTAGAAGLKLAYDIAKKSFLPEGNNRVILATDGDFNVGPSSNSELVRLIEEKRNQGIFLTVLGFGMGNLKDSKMEKLADKGNGNYAYIDNLLEAKKVLVKEFASTLFTVAKDVKIQVEFNPDKVQAYRLVGYENRVMQKEDFQDDGKDAGEVGAGHRVTALYEIIPAGLESGENSMEDLRYMKSDLKPEALASKELMTVKLRYKLPSEEQSKLSVYPVEESFKPIGASSDDFRFSAAVAEFGMLLRNSEFRAESSYKDVIHLAKQARGKDEEGYRGEFIKLVELAEILTESKR
jgi:Ca-activated chloride channel family protein